MKKAVVYLVAGLLTLAVGARAGVFIIDYEEWPTAGDLQGWTITDDLGGGAAGSLSVPAGDGNPPPALRIDATTGSGITIDRIFTFNNPYLAGNQDYTSWISGDARAAAQYIWFDFYNNDVAAPGDLSLFFVSDTSGVTWYYFIDTPLSVGWTTFRIPMFGNGWTDLGAGGVWASDIQDVDQIGLRIVYKANSSQYYILDNFRRGYVVPEPSTYAALGFAFVSLGMTFRRKLNEGLSRLFKS